MKEQFLKDVENHKLYVLRDDGLYRHLRFKDPRTICQYFDVVTWPGYLAYSGDMGCFVFNRIEDMLCFFRNEKEDWGINEGYWAEKLEAVDSRGGYKEFSWDLFVENLMEYCETDEQKAWMNEELRSAEEDEYGAIEFYRNFDNDNEAGVDLSDFWECRHDEPTFRFLWCCHALVWGIQQYDKSKLEAAA